MSLFMIGHKLERLLRTVWRTENNGKSQFVMYPVIIQGSESEVIGRYHMMNIYHGLLSKIRLKAVTCVSFYGTECHG